MECMASRVAHTDDLVAELPGHKVSTFMHGFKITAATVEQEDADLLAIGTASNLGWIHGFVYRHADVPFHVHGLDTHDVLYISPFPFQGKIGLVHEIPYHGDDLFLRNIRGWDIISTHRNTQSQKTQAKHSQECLE